MTTLPTYKSFKIFLSSPGDLIEERNAADEVIKEVDRVLRETIGLRTECVRWEDFLPIKPSRGDIQDTLNSEINKTQGFVLILNKRYGSTTSRENKSNTEREVDAALKMLKKQPNYSIFAYFHELLENQDPGQQEIDLKSFRERLISNGVFYKSFKSVEDFKTKFTHDIYKLLLSFHHSTIKVSNLKKFWQLGIAEAQNHPRLAIIYPPVNRTYLKKENPDRLWLNRLVPYIVFEDFKALHKIDKTLRLIGHNDISTYSSIDFPQEVYEMNRVWLCLPRNHHAINQLTQYKERRFSFEDRQPLRETRIHWQSLKENNKYIIESPLSKYLQLQREKIPGGEWKTEHARIYAKDYAILARFNNRSGNKPTIEGTLKDFFVAGIRGLGTWGAAWFLDRRYNLISNHSSNDNPTIQMLLEVTYQNGVISDVKDVSKETYSYFKNENSLATIRSRIRQNK